MVMIPDLPIAQTPLADDDITLVFQGGHLKQTAKENLVRNEDVDQAILDLAAVSAQIDALADVIPDIQAVAAALPFDPNASEVPYDNVTSGLIATDVQAALDEIVATPIADGDYGDITAAAGNLFINAGLPASRIADGTVSSIEFQYLNGVTSPLQTQLDAKQPLDATITALAGLGTGANKIPMASGTDTFTQLDFKDEDDMSSNSATAVPSQQSVKAYVDAATAGGVPDGDKGDIVVSSSGTIWSIDTGVIVNADINASAAIDASKISAGAVSNTEFDYLDGVTSAIQTQFTGKQPLDATLTAVAGISGTAGLLTQTSADNFAQRTITGTANEITVTNGSGAAGNPTLSLPTGIDPAKLANGTVSATEFQYLDGVTSAIQTQIDAKVVANGGITGATKTKITYDTKGLVTSGADATTADIADSSNKRYVTDAELTVLGNTSNTNSGDQPVFKTISVAGQSDVVADSTTDTLTIAAGANVTITTNAGTDTITIAASGGGGGGLADGDYGDITISGTSTVLTIDPATVTLAKMADLAQDQFIGRTTASTGVPQTATITAAARTVLDDTTVSAMVDTLGGASAQGSGGIVRETSPTITTAVLGSSTATTQSPGDNSTKLATTAYVQAAIFATDIVQAVKYATTAALTATYSNGSSGVGATLTEVGLGAISIDGSTPSVADRVLVKNQASTFQNGIYTVTTVGTAGLAYVLTRATDYNVAAEIDLGDSIFVSAGSTLLNTTWAQNGTENPVMGTDAITFAQTAGVGSYTAGNGITITGTSVAIDTSVTVDKNTSQTLTNKTLTSPTLTTPVLGTPSSGTLTNCTLPVGGITGLGTGVGTFLATPSSANLISAVTDETGSGALVFGTTPTIATAVLNGTITGTSQDTNATASTLMMRDANKNVATNNLLEGYTTTTSSGGTVTMTAADTHSQFLTGSSTHTFKLPDVTTIPLGTTYFFRNDSSSNCTVQSSGANGVLVMLAGTQGWITSILTTGTTAASWKATHLGAVAASGKKLTITNSATLTGTDNASIAFGSGGTIMYTASPALDNETFSVAATVTAGTNAQAQGAMTSDVNIVTTTTANPSGVTLPTATVGRRIFVINKGTNPINVYPASGGTIDALTINTSIQIPVAGVMYFNASTTTQWYSSGNSTFSAPTLGTPLSGTLTNCAMPETALTFTDVATNNSSTSKHGFLLKLDNTATHYMDGTGAWSTPASGVANVTLSTGTATYTPVAGDKGKVIQLTGSTARSLTFTAAATLGAGWWCYTDNASTAEWTFDPNASETVDGLTTFISYPGEKRLVLCDGSNFTSHVLHSGTASYTASGTWTKPPGYKMFGGRLAGGGASGGKTNSATIGGAGGGGSACFEFDIDAGKLGATETVTIGAGGTSVTVANTDGVAGGTTTFGTHASSFGGGGGGGNTNHQGGGGGGGFQTVGQTPGTTVSGNGGQSQLLPVAAGVVVGANPGLPSFWGGGSGGGGDGGVASVGGASEWGGAGGGAGGDAAAVGGAGGASRFGGGGGGGAGGDASPGGGAGGASVYGGAGGRGGQDDNGVAGTAGVNGYGSGGGGGADNAFNSGAGAAGSMVIWGIC